MLKSIISLVKKGKPNLQNDLASALMNISLERFISQCLFNSLFISFLFSLIISVFIFIFFFKSFFMILLWIPIFIVSFFLFFFVLLGSPVGKRQKLAKKIEAEAAITGRRLLIHLESGKSLQRCIIDISKSSASGKDKTGNSLQIVAYELYMGKSLETAVANAIKNSPSVTFKRIFIQIHNSLRTGSDLKKSLNATIQEIQRNKIVEFESFGKKLNPVCMFYMFGGAVIPSLGVVVFSIILALIRIKIDLIILTFFLVFIIIIQVIFIYIFFNMRPQLEI